MKTTLRILVSTAAMMVSLGAHAQLAAADNGAVVSDATLNVTWANVLATFTT